MFFHFHQNNSGGGFHENVERGIGVNVIIEAYNAKDANRRAERLGLYFDGEGDCPCCGNRWYEVSDADGKEEPRHYDDVVIGGKPSFKWHSWWGQRYTGYIHYKDGRIEPYWPNPEDVAMTREPKGRSR
jgi:hypothetical protein